MLPALDPATVASLKDLGDDVLHDLLGGFGRTLRAVPDRLAGLEGDELARALHRLRGSSASYAALDLAAVCATAEDAVRRGAVVREELGDVLAEAERAARAVEGLVRSLAASEPQARP